MKSIMFSFFVFLILFSSMGFAEPLVTIASPTNTTYDTASIDLDWSANETLLDAWYSLNGAGNVSLLGWGINSTIISGLGDIGGGSAPTIFQKDGTWYLISGASDGKFYGFNWTGSTWQSDSAINSSLGDVGGYSKPTVFEKNSTWYLISGELDGVFNGFNWTGSTWQSDTAITSGLSNYGGRSTPTVFEKDSTWYLLAGENDGVFNGFNWTGSTWQSDSAINSGLGDIGGGSTPTVFEKDSTWYLISGMSGGTFFGFNWTGSTWQSYPTIALGFGDVGSSSAPIVFEKDSTWYLLAGENDGVFNGFKWTTRNITITASEGSNNVTVYANDTNGNVGSETEYFTVEIIPIITIESPTNTTYSTTSIDLNVSADETIDTWWYSLNGETNQTFTPNTNITASEGSNNVTVYANDTRGNLGSSIQYFTIDTTAPTVILASPTNTTYDTASIDINWSANETLLDAWYSLNGAGNVSLALSDGWQSDYTINSNLGDVGGYSKPTVFQKDSTWYLISGNQLGTFNGFNWTGSTWQSDYTINSSLGDIGANSKPTVFQKDSTWYLISGASDGKFYGFNWTGSTWQSDSAINSSLGDVGGYSAPTVFQKDSTWYLFAGQTTAIYGFNWTGSTWQSDTAITSGLSSLGNYIEPTIFEKDSTWYLITGDLSGTFKGFNWTGSTWQSDTVIISGLGDIGSQSTPTVFEKDSTWYMISGMSAGTFFGFNWATQNITITASEGSNNVTVYANDTNGNVGEETEYFTVSIFVSNAVFSIAMPSDYLSPINVSGENETDATSYDWISFNFTERPQYYVQPYQLGNATNNQNGATQPIFLIDNTGNVNINISFRFASTLPTGITVEGNSSCSGTYTSCQSTSTLFGTSYTQLVNNLSYTDSFANITLYSNMTSDAVAGGSGITMYIQGVES